jgi:RNA polymerase sigma-70 factor (ECF subfamily)
MNEDLETFRRISNNDIQAYESVFKKYYKFLCSYAFGLLRNKESAEEIVEDFFVELWSNRNRLNITSSVRSYFVGAIHNRCLNYLSREKPKSFLQQDVSKFIDQESATGDKLITLQVPSLLTNELENALVTAIEKLPPSCKEVFILSRFKNFNYEEIAKQQNISVNTVKTQIKIALRKLKETLKDYFIVFVMFMLK